MGSKINRKCLILYLKDWKFD